MRCEVVAVALMNPRLGILLLISDPVAIVAIVLTLSLAACCLLPLFLSLSHHLPLNLLFVRCLLLAWQTHPSWQPAAISVRFFLLHSMLV